MDLRRNLCVYALCTVCMVLGAFFTDVLETALRQPHKTFVLGTQRVINQALLLRRAKRVMNVP